MRPGRRQCTREVDLPTEDTGIVGAPGTDANGPNSIACEALTYLYLPEGPITMGVRSDDGFQVQIGGSNPEDRYSPNAPVVDFYNGGRSAGDSIVTFNVAQAGLYAARLFYYQGTGNASVEWYSFRAAGHRPIPPTLWAFLTISTLAMNAVFCGRRSRWRGLGGLPVDQQSPTKAPTFPT